MDGTIYVTTISEVVPSSYGISILHTCFVNVLPAVSIGEGNSETQIVKVCINRREKIYLFRVIVVIVVVNLTVRNTYTS